jgi:hypothetical protein
MIAPYAPEPKWVPVEPENPAYPVGSIGDDWGFWDETWSHWYGGYGSEAFARDALSVYCLTL